MPFPASLTLVTVTIQADLPPSGGNAPGWIDFTSAQPLLGSAMVPPFTSRAWLDTTGAGSIQLPATNDPQWSPVDWSYAVTGYIGGRQISGTIQLDYQTAAVDFAARFQSDGTVETGVSYLLTSQRGAVSGVAGLDADGDVIDADGTKILASASTPSGTVVAETAFGASSTAGVASTYSRGDHTHGTPAAPTPASIGALPTTGGTVSGDLAVQGTLRVTPGATIEIGADTNIYRAGANQLGTDDGFAVGGQLHSYTGISSDGPIEAEGVDLGAAVAACTSIYYWNGSSYAVVNGANVYVGGSGPVSPVNGDVWFP